MATYEFKCEDPVCGSVTTRESPIGEPVPDGPVFCLVCALGLRPDNIPTVSRMKRVWHAATVILRGGGWASKS